MLRVPGEPEIRAFPAVESFSGYAVRYLKPEVTQNWRVGRIALGGARWGRGEERLTGSGREEETKSRVSQFSRPRSPAESAVWGMGAAGT